MTFDERAREERRETDTRAALDRALRSLEKAKATREELVAAVYSAAKDAAETISVPPVPKPKAHDKKRPPETAVCILADWQVGKTTPTYDSEVAADRVRLYAEKVARLITLHHAPVDEAVVLLLGDLVEGELVFPGQSHRIDASLYRQTFHVAQLLAEIVRTIAAAVPAVRVVGVIGNHGAIGGPVRRESHPETNADAMAYNVARLLVEKEPRIDWEETFVRHERAWYRTVEVRGRQWWLFHGDQIKGGAFGYPWYGLNKRLLGWQTSVAPFDYSASGHWHQPVRVQVNTVTHWGAGSTESSNTFAQEYLASGGQEPSQWLIFQGDDGVTAEYLVRLGGVAG